MIKFYFHPSPNPLKIALYLEETGEPYELIGIDTRKGEQHSEAFKAINPNAKTPAMVDGDIRVFDSNAMLIYLAEKTGKFVPPNTPASKAEMYSWLMFVATGIGPYCGQAVHFHVKRLLDEINERPAAQRAEALKTQFTFKTEVDEDARKMLFPSNERLSKAGT